MLRPLKLSALRWAVRSGFSSVVLDSVWRRQRLLILCYHGVSLHDEHEWKPTLYVTPDHLRERLEFMRRENYAVLPLDEALRRLYTGQLPPRSVCLTFDDGSYDFYSQAYPIIKEHEFPVTLYLTTYYSDYNRPVFDVMASYLLWKGRGRILEWPEVLTAAARLDETGRQVCERQIKSYAVHNRLSAEGKNDLLACLAEKLEIDYRNLCSKRILHLISKSEARELVEEGVDIQLHTHRHRAPLQRDGFLREIDDNRKSIRAFSSSEARHFCYPSGFHAPQFKTWLTERNIVSATTCESGLASSRTHPLLLPRLVDQSKMTAEEFAGWLSGVAAFLPRRSMSVNKERWIQKAALALL